MDEFELMGLFFLVIGFIVENFWPILIISFIIGLFTRKEGDGCVDTISSGCGAIISGVIFLIIVCFIISKCS